MLLLYAEKLTPRLRYTARLIFEDLLGLPLRFTTDRETYLQTHSAKINYSRIPLQSGIYLQAAKLLFETDIFEQRFKTSTHRGVPIFFLTGKSSQLPFDPLAAAFYLVSRYEEYIPFIADEHHRFPAEESLLFKLGGLHLPVVNAYAEWLQELLQESHPRLKFKKPQYRFVNSVDIDNAAAYLGKGIFRIMGSYARDLVQLNFSEIWQRTLSLTGRRSDPYETFDYVQGLQDQYGFKSIFFVLFTRLGQYDRSLTRYSSRLHSYIKGIADFSEVGIHPSYRSYQRAELMEEELLSLERVLRKDVTRSRQHFLRMSFPITYRHLLELEIEHDYSMGFSTHSGFRAGICTPFRFYDLEQEIETPLVVHPFPFMDGTYIYGQRMDPEEAMEEIETYIRTYRKYGGEFIPVWHNRIFSEKDSEWRGWNQVFEKMVKSASNS